MRSARAAEALRSTPATIAIAEGKRYRTRGDCPSFRGRPSIWLVTVSNVGAPTTHRCGRRFALSRRDGYRGLVPQKKGMSSNAMLGLGLAGCAALVAVALLGMKLLTA